MRKTKSILLSQAIHEFLREEGMETPYNEYRAIQCWPEVAGPAIARMTTDVKIQNNVMYIKISRPALRQDLMMGRTALTQRVNQHVGAQIIENIVFY